MLEKSKWLTTQIEHDELPLLLRLRNYSNIWDYQSKLEILTCVTHNFDYVRDNGLPTSEYNKSLIDFDEEVVNLCQSSNDCIIFLIETYGGARNYWFYTSDENIPTQAFQILKRNHPDKKLEIDCSSDADWGFIKEYPIQLYKLG